MTDKQAAQQIVRDYYLSGTTTHAELEEIICEALGKAREQGRAELQAEQDKEWERLMEDLKAARGEYQPIVDESPTLERVEGDEVRKAVGAEQVDQAVISPTAEQIRERLVAASKNLHARCYRGPYNCDSPAWEGRLFERCDVCEARDLIGHVLSLLDQRDAEIAKLAVIAGNWKLATGGFEALKELGKQAASLLRRMTEEVARLREDRNLAQTAAAEWRDKLAEVTVKLEEHKDCVKQATHAFAVRYAEQMTVDLDQLKMVFREDAIRAGEVINSLKAQVARLTEELDLLRTSGIIEVAIRNPNVSSYMDHWEGRTLKAEASLARLTESHEQLKTNIEALELKRSINDELHSSGYVHKRFGFNECRRQVLALLAPPEEKKAVNGDR